MRDNETGRLVYIDTSRKSVREDYAEWARKAFEESLIVLRKYKIDTVSVKTDDDYVKSLIMLFKTKG